MLKNECSICGGKIANGKCTDCGLKSSGSGNQYQEINGVWVRKGSRSKVASNHQPSPSVGQPPRNNQKPVERTSTYQKSVEQTSTYQKSVKQTNTYQKPVQTVGREYRAPQSTPVQPGNDRKNSRKKGSVMVTIGIILALFSGVRKLVTYYTEQRNTQLSAKIQEYDVDSDYNYSGTVQAFEDYYPNSAYEIPAEGESFSIVLGEGQYIVGTDIPEGVYRITGITGSGVLTWIDDSNGIEEYNQLDDAEWNGGYMYFPVDTNDIRLYRGALLELSSGLTMTIDTQNAQPYLEETTP